MRTLRKHFVFLFSFLFVFVFISLISSPLQAASLKFDRGTVSAAAGDTFTLDATIDAGSDQVTSTDMWILYDPALLEAQSASPGAYFPAVTNNISGGKVYIAGLITDPGTYKTGTGTVAKITFKALKNGTATITYDCRADASNSSKVIKNAVDPVNVINCAQNGTSIVTIGTGGTNPTTAPQPTSLYQQQVQPTALPQSGIMDEMPKLMTIGGILVMIGVAMRLILL